MLQALSLHNHLLNRRNAWDADDQGCNLFIGIGEAGKEHDTVQPITNQNFMGEVDSWWGMCGGAAD